jgi:putative ABC transport system permease protein
MLRVALKMLWGDRPKYIGLLIGITFVSFLVTFALSYLDGFMSRGFALVTENPGADVWVMDPAVESTELTTNIPDSALTRVRSVDGVRSAMPLALTNMDARFPDGRFQSFQIIAVDQATLFGLPPLENGVSPVVMRTPDAAVVAAGGTDGKLQTPALASDQWPYRSHLGEASKNQTTTVFYRLIPDFLKPNLGEPTRELAAGDVLLVNDHRVLVRGRAMALPRYPPQPLMYTTISNAARMLPPERHLLTFILAKAAPGISPRELAVRIEAQTGLRARSSEDFKTDTVDWLLINSEDVGDMVSMVSIAMLVGLGVTGVMLYMFTSDSLRQYAVLKAMGADSRLLLTMIFVQSGVCALLGIGLGLGICAVVGKVAAAEFDYPFRMMWFNPILGSLMVIVVSIVAAAISARPVLKLEPGVVFAGR